jgi:hypothetical protein
MDYPNATLHAERTRTGGWHRDAIRLRDLHRALDQAVLTAYARHQPGPDGPTIDLAHDFQQVGNLPKNDCTRNWPSVTFTADDTNTPAAAFVLTALLITLKD